MKEEKILKILCERGHEAYIVGGFVRDIFIEYPSFDIDIVTSASVDEIEDIFTKLNFKVDIVGKSFKVIIVDGIEVAEFRHDLYDENGNVSMKSAKTLIDDLSRRDLTINSIAICPNGKIFDPFNGLKDIEEKIIRFVGDPYKRIKEDPLRIIRACRFKALIDGRFEENSKRAIKENIYLLQNIPKERFRIEIMKAMKIKKASMFFRTLIEINTLFYIFPSIQSCFEFRYHHGEYHEESIFDHIMMVGDFISTKFPLLKLSGYLHDIGKIFSYEISEDGKITFKTHEKIGSKIIRKELRDLKFSNEEVDYISNIIRIHMRRPTSSRAIRKILINLNEMGIDYRDFIRIFYSDMKGKTRRTIKIFSLKDVFKRIKEEDEKEPVKKYGDLPINGHNIMEYFNIKEGPLIGEILDIAMEIILDYPELKDDKEKLLRLIKEKLREEEK